MMNSFLSLAVLATAALSAPLTTRQASTTNGTCLYNLKTQLINGPQRFNNLYVESYHTGAGFSDATLGNTTENAAPGFLNTTSSAWQIVLGSETIVWALDMGSDTNYAAWEPVQINAAADPSPGFYFNGTAAPGLLWGSGSAPSDFENGQFQDWIACDWSHGVPQLFWHYRYYNFSLPETCAEVWLIPEEA